MSGESLSCASHCPCSPSGDAKRETDRAALGRRSGFEGACDRAGVVRGCDVSVTRLARLRSQFVCRFRGRVLRGRYGVARVPSRRRCWRAGRLGARPCRRCRLARTRKNARRLAWNSGVGPRRQEAVGGCEGGGDLAGQGPARPGRRGAAARARPQGRVAAVELRVRRRAWCPGRPSTVKGASRRKRRPQPGRPGRRSLCDPKRSGVKRQAGGLPARGRTPPQPSPTRRCHKPGDVKSALTPKTREA